MLQKTFGIYSEVLAGCSLFIETGTDYIACWCKDAETKAVKAFELFSFTEEEGSGFEKTFEEVKLNSRLFSTVFEKAHCIWGDDKCVCMPEEFYSEQMAASMLGVMLGENPGVEICTGTINGIVTVSVVQTGAKKQYEKLYCELVDTHKYHQLIKGQTNGSADSKMYVVFYSAHCIISAYKNGMLQFIQTYNYKTPEDVLYSILNACNAHEMAVGETKIIASGLIDTSSPLYILLNTYLDHFSFAVADRDLYAAEDFHAHPLHYFASFCQYEV